MSSSSFATRIPRLRSASIVVVLATVGFGVWMLFWNPLSSSAAPSTNNDRDVGAATANLEVLHQRTVATTRAHEDDDQQKTTWGHAVTPEQATDIAQKVARSRGAVATKQVYVELQTRNGRPVYAVRMGMHSVYVDAETGGVAF